MKKIYSIIINLCGITSIILIIYFVIGNIDRKNFIPVVFPLIYLILNHKKNKNHKEYKKHDGIKKVFTGLMVFYITIFSLMAFGQWFHKI